jgi:hypothetical protein
MITLKVNNRTEISVMQTDRYDEFMVLVRNNGRLSPKAGGCYTMAALIQKYPSLNPALKKQFKPLYAV